MCNAFSLIRVAVLSLIPTSYRLIASLGNLAYLTWPHVYQHLACYL